MERKKDYKAKGKLHPKFIDRTGERHITNQGYPFTIIECNGYYDNTILFDDGTILKNRLYDQVVKKNLNHPYHPTVHSVGYYGQGKYDPENNIIHRKYAIRWRNIIQRCYSERRLNEHPSYRGTEVCEEWKCFQNFAEWFEKTWNPDYMQDWQVDKDILIKGNKLYSVETCCLVPPEINGLFVKVNKSRGKYLIGVIKKGKKFQARCNIQGKTIVLGTFRTEQEAFQIYKIAKEKEIKRIANKWRGKITEECYWTLMNYIVEETD